MSGPAEDPTPSERTDVPQLPDEEVDSDALLIQRATQLLTINAPRDWAEIRMDFRASSTICQADMSGSMLNGDSLLMPLPAGMTEIMRHLRVVMYEPENGTWFSLHVILRRNMTPDFRFNYTEDPKWSPPVAPTLFTLDLERFPRVPEHIPSWLRDRLDEASLFEQEYREHDESDSEQ
ncbi:hypothetical protein [Parasphingorhabdus pacifica]